MFLIGILILIVLAVGINLIGFRIGFKRGYLSGLLSGWGEADSKWLELSNTIEQNKAKKRKELIKSASYLKVIK